MDAARKRSRKIVYFAHIRINDEISNIVQREEEARVFMIERERERAREKEREREIKRQREQESEGLLLRDRRPPPPTSWSFHRYKLLQFSSRFTGEQN